MKSSQQSLPIFTLDFIDLLGDSEQKVSNVDDLPSNNTPSVTTTLLPLEVALPNIPPPDIIERIQKGTNPSPKPSLPGLKALSPTFNLPCDNERFKQWVTAEDSWAPLLPSHNLRAFQHVNSVPFSDANRSLVKCTKIASAYSLLCSDLDQLAKPHCLDSVENPLFDKNSARSSLFQIASQIPTPTPHYQDENAKQENRGDNDPRNLLRNEKGSSTCVQMLTPPQSSYDLPLQPLATTMESHVSQETMNAWKARPLTSSKQAANESKRKRSNELLEYSQEDRFLSHATATTSCNWNGPTTTFQRNWNTNEGESALETLSAAALLDFSNSHQLSSLADINTKEEIESLPESQSNSNKSTASLDSSLDSSQTDHYGNDFYSLHPNRRKENHIELDEKRKQFLERNRQAAMKCRRRKKQQISLLEASTEGYRTYNCTLEAQIATFHREIDCLRRSLSIPANSCKVKRNLA
jgi:hypothetical protein